MTIARRVSLLLGENEGVELLASVQGVKVLRLIQAPEHGGSVLATWRVESSGGGDGNGVDVAGVSDVVLVRWVAFSGVWRSVVSFGRSYELRVFDYQ